MSQFLKENIYQSKNLTQNRVLLLTDKINSLKIGQKAEGERNVDALEKQVNDLEGQLESMINTFNDKQCQIRHTFTKINKELAYDYQQLDKTLKEETQNCQQMTLNMISHHIQDRKASDARISRFIDEKCAILRDLIDRQAKERTISIKEIEESLERDLNEIRQKLQTESKLREQRIEVIHQEFLIEYEKMHEEFKQLNEKYAESEGEFYKMLRDVLKKVKTEIGEGKKEREEMEESILVLIEKLCDKAMEEAGVR